MAKKKDKKKAIVYEVWTDGSCKGNPGPGGYGAIVRCGDQEVTLSKGYFITTNNRQEMMAVIATLEEFGPAAHFEFFCDSEYVIKGSTSWVKNWYRNNWVTRNGDMVKNKDLWIILNELLMKNKVKFIKVKGHSGIPLNERADQLCKLAADNPTEYDMGFKQ